MRKTPQARLIRQLAKRIRDIEQKEHRLARPEQSEGRDGISLEKIFPEEIRSGSLVELLSTVQGAGAWTLALLLAKQACGEQKALVVADVHKCFYPPAACQLGIDLSRTIVIRPEHQRGSRPGTEYSVSNTQYRVLSTQYSVLSTERSVPTQHSVLRTQYSEPSTERSVPRRPVPIQHSVLSTQYSVLRSSLFAAIVQSLRCPSVGAVMGWFDKLPSLDFRRLQLAAEAGGGLGLLLRPLSALRAPSFAAARLLVTPVASGKENLRRIHIEMIRMRGKAGQSVIVEVDDETGHVHVPTRVASAKTPARAARSSG